MCFHWKSLLRQIRIVGKIYPVEPEEADEYYNSRLMEVELELGHLNKVKF